MSETDKTRQENIQGASTFGRQIRWIAAGIEFSVLFAFWVLISGHYQLRYLLIGVGFSALVTYITKDLLYKPEGKQMTAGARFIFACGWRLILYIPWLIWAIIKANIQMALIILNPHLPIDPGFLQFKTRLAKKVSLVTLANSITLTPGTITVDLTSNVFVVHAITRSSASDLESGHMQNKVGVVFGESWESPPSCSWVHSCEELKR